MDQQEEAVSLEDCTIYLSTKRVSTIIIPPCYRYLLNLRVGAATWDEENIFAILFDPPLLFSQFFEEHEYRFRKHSDIFQNEANLSQINHINGIAHNMQGRIFVYADTPGANTNFSFFLYTEELSVRLVLMKSNELHENSIPENLRFLPLGGLIHLIHTGNTVNYNGNTVNQEEPGPTINYFENTVNNGNTDVYHDDNLNYEVLRVGHLQYRTCDCVSDVRQKELIELLDEQTTVEIIRNLPIYKYRLDGYETYGLTSQDLRAKVPFLTKEDNGTLMIDSDGFNSIVAKSAQILFDRYDQLEQRVLTIENRHASLDISGTESRIYSDEDRIDLTLISMHPDGLICDILGPETNLSYQSNKTIRDLIEAIWNQFCLSESPLHFSLTNAFKVPYNQSLPLHQLEEKTLFCSYSNSEQLRTVCITVDGNPFSFTVPNSTSIMDLKLKLYYMTGISPLIQQYCFESKMDLAISNDSHLYQYHKQFLNNILCTTCCDSPVTLHFRPSIYKKLEYSESLDANSSVTTEDIKSYVRSKFGYKYDVHCYEQGTNISLQSDIVEQIEVYLVISNNTFFEISEESNLCFFDFDGWSLEKVGEENISGNPDAVYPIVHKGYPLVFFIYYEEGRITCNSLISFQPIHIDEDMLDSSSWNSVKNSFVTSDDSVITVQLFYHDFVETYYLQFDLELTSLSIKSAIGCQNHMNLDLLGIGRKRYIEINRDDQCINLYVLENHTFLINSKITTSNQNIKGLQYCGKKEDKKETCLYMQNRNELGIIIVRDDIFISCNFFNLPSIELTNIIPFPNRYPILQYDCTLLEQEYAILHDSSLTRIRGSKQNAKHTRVYAFDVPKERINNRGPNLDWNINVNDEIKVTPTVTTEFRIDYMYFEIQLADVVTLHHTRIEFEETFNSPIVTYIPVSGLIVDAENNEFYIGKAVVGDILFFRIKQISKSKTVELWINNSNYGCICIVATNEYLIPTIKYPRNEPTSIPVISSDYYTYQSQMLSYSNLTPKRSISPRVYIPVNAENLKPGFYRCNGTFFSVSGIIRKVVIILELSMDGILHGAMFEEYNEITFSGTWDDRKFQFILKYGLSVFVYDGFLENDTFNGNWHIQGNPNCFDEDKGTFSFSIIENCGLLSTGVHYFCKGMKNGCEGGAVWGTEIYTSDSNRCSAALHSGIFDKQGGILKFTVEKGRSSYAGSFSNGINSFEYGIWGASYSINNAIQLSPTCGRKVGNLFYCVGCAPRGTVPVESIPPFNICLGAQSEGLIDLQTGSYFLKRNDIYEPPTCCFISDSMFHCIGEDSNSHNSDVWGSNPFTICSNPCLAAIHTGVIPKEGGDFRIIFNLPEISIFNGSEVNGIISLTFKGYSKAFQIRFPINLN